MERPPLYSSVETTNGTKLSRLLIDGGTRVLKNLFNTYYPPANLVPGLNAKYLILNDLLRRKVLFRKQWDLLFPSSGDIPDSNTFDISLLFILLTNICGLSPPSSGWHAKPASNDTSLAANIAYLKYFRNELYGHVTSTGVDTSTFSALWQELSVALVALGLDQAEIDRLKEERCGEEQYLNVVFDWVDSDADIKSQLKDVIRAQKNTQQVVEEMHRMLRNSLPNASRLEESASNEILKNLAKSEFKGDIEFHVGRYQPETRDWVFKVVEDWLDDKCSKNRVLVISGDAGMGKSVIAAVICQRMQENGRLSGSHFCQHNNFRYRDPRLMLQSLACHLSHALPEYERALVEQLSRNVGTELDNLGVEDLFALLFKEPLSTVSDPGRNILTVIDGLDESEYQGRNELLDVIANQFCKLPLWIRFLVTTRPEKTIIERLKRLKPFHLEPSGEKNLQDIRLFFQSHLQDGPDNDCLDKTILNKLVEKSEGLMLYAYFLVEFLENNVALLDQVHVSGSPPLGISSVYLSYFKRLEADLQKEVGISEETFLTFLSIVTVAREPLPLAIIYKVLGPHANGTSRSNQRRVNKAISCVSTLLPIRNGRLHFIHKSVRDWLTDKCLYGDHDFLVDEGQGHRLLAEICRVVLDEVRLKEVHGRCFSDTDRYALQHGVQHMLKVEKELRFVNFQETVEKYVMDLELVYAKLCVHNAYDTAASEDVLLIQTQDISQKLPEQLQGALNKLLFVLQKHRNTLRSLPSNFFQLVLNEGGQELADKAANMLQNKYYDIPYMENLAEEASEGITSVKLHCSDTVACIDVSPQLDYMVCECHDGSIQLWSLKTRKLEWVRTVIYRKEYSGVPFGSAYKIPPSSEDADSTLRPLSCYRSVVFHPNGRFILPGNLSQVYKVNGEKETLFPSCTCAFSFSLFSKDNTRMLTDCIDKRSCVIMWNLVNGTEVTRIERREPILSFTCSQDGKLLALSHPHSVCLFEVARDNFRFMEGTTTPVACGLMKLSQNNQELTCLHLTEFSKRLLHFNIHFNYSQSVPLTSIFERTDQDLESSGESCPWEFEQGVNIRFLLGDLTSLSSEALSTVVPFWEVGMLSVLNEEIALMSSPDLNYLSLINVRNLSENIENSKMIVKEIAFSPNGNRLYVLGEDATRQVTLTVWDTSHGNRMRGRINLFVTSFIPVTQGVVLLAQNKQPHLWNLDVCECIRSWDSLKGITKMISISNELIACVGSQGEVIILEAVANGTILWTGVPMGQRRVIACNSEYHLLTVGPKYQIDTMSKSGTEGTLQMSNIGCIVWERDLTLPLCEDHALPHCIFSPKEDLMIVWGEPIIDGPGVHILDSASGNTCRTLPNSKNVVGCQFVGDKEVLVYNKVINVLRMFSVTSGNLLSVMDMEERPKCVAVCLCRNLIAVCFKGFTFKQIQVWLPGTKGTRKCERLVYRLSDCITDPGIIDLFILTEAAYMSDQSAGLGASGAHGVQCKIPEEFWSPPDRFR